MVVRASNKSTLPVSKLYDKKLGGRRELGMIFFLFMGLKKHTPEDRTHPVTLRKRGTRKRRKGPTIKTLRRLTPGINGR